MLLKAHKKLKVFSKPV